jgi:hypothetical protein
VRAAWSEAGEFPLEQTTFVRKNAPPPSSAHAGSIVRAQYASPTPRSDAHTSVATNGHTVRFCCGDDGRLAAAAADVWFELDTVRIPAGE